MPSFCYVKDSEANCIAKVIEDCGSRLLVEFFDVPGPDGRVTREVAKSNVRLAVLGRNTRVYAYDEYKDLWSVGRVLEDDGDGLLVRFAHKVDTYLPYERAFVRWKRPIRDPLVFLAHQITETPMYAEARSGFLDSYIGQRGASQGMSALLSSAVELEPHQIDVVRRVISDPSQRYLLADEVGLGKTIEAGVIIRQAVLDDPVGHRIVILVPHTLVAQWRDELVRRFGLRDFLDDSVYVLPQELGRELREALKGATMLVIDEAHHVAASGADGAATPLYETLRLAALACPSLLLLSATPILRNESGFLRMLYLLDPVVYSLQDEASFKLKIEHRQALAETVANLDPTQVYFLEGTVDDLLTKLPNDERLSELTQDLRAVLVNNPHETDDALVDALRQVRAHISETYRLNRRILRNRRRQVPGLTPDRKGVDAWRSLPAGLSVFEESLEAWRIAANSALSEHEISGRNVLIQCYAGLVSAILEDPSAIAALCRRRMDSIALGDVYSFEGEETLLADMVARCNPADWLDARLTALSNHLRQLPTNSKAIVFCSSNNVADEILARLKHDHIAVVRHATSEHDDSERRPDWTRFLTDATMRVIVCDREAEEGVNLQGGHKVVVHFDLPMQPNRIEQRIGRADRFGIGAAVHSYAVIDADSQLQKLWLAVLADGWGIFGRSISSLQYVVEAEIAGLGQALFRDGSEAFGALLDRLQGPKGLVATELRLIDQQDALDELAPASEDTMESLLDIDSDWKDIQQAMLHWISDTLFFEKIPERMTEQVTDIPLRFQYCPPTRDGQATLIPLSGFLDDFLGAIDYTAPGGSSSRPRSHAHTAHRGTAVRRALRLLRYGDEFVEAVRLFSDVDDRGRSFAMWRQIHAGFEHKELQICFRFDFLVQADLGLAERVLGAQGRSDASLADRAVLRRRADALFPPQVFHVWVDGDGEALPLDFVDAHLSQPYAKQGGAGYIDKNVDQSHFHALKKMMPDRFESWQQRCMRARDAALTQVSGQVSLKEGIRTALRRAREQDANRYAQLATRVRSLAGKEADAERSQLGCERSLNEALYGGIQVPSIQVDVAGVVFVSGEPVATLQPGMAAN
jgi:ATP-dependent helicase HepA